MKILPWTDEEDARLLAIRLHSEAKATDAGSARKINWLEHLNNFPGRAHADLTVRYSPVQYLLRPLTASVDRQERIMPRVNEVLADFKAVAAREMQQTSQGALNLQLLNPRGCHAERHGLFLRRSLDLPSRGSYPRAHGPLGLYVRAPP